jgi:hypothetical protein
MMISMLVIYNEEHCDWCKEIAHNHFDCPVCKSLYAGTSVYGDMNDLLDVGEAFECEECRAKFTLRDRSGSLFEYDDTPANILSSPFNITEGV